MICIGEELGDEARGGGGGGVEREEETQIKVMSFTSRIETHLEIVEYY